MLYLTPHVLLIQSTLLYPTVFVHSFNMSKPPFLCSFLCLPNPGNLLTPQNIFYLSVSHYTSTVPPRYFSPALPSPLFSLPRSHYHREQHSDTCMESFYFLCVVKSSLNFFQQHLILATSNSSHI